MLMSKEAGPGQVLGTGRLRPSQGHLASVSGVRSEPRSTSAQAPSIWPGDAHPPLSPGARDAVGPWAHRFRSSALSRGQTC